MLNHHVKSLYVNSFLALGNKYLHKKELPDKQLSVHSEQ